METTTAPLPVIIDLNQRKYAYPLCQQWTEWPRITFVHDQQVDVGNFITIYTKTGVIAEIVEERPAKGDHPEGVWYYDVTVKPEPLPILPKQ